MQMHNLLTRDNPSALEVRDAAMRPQTFDAAERTIEVIVATDAPVTRRDAQGEYDEVLDIAGADLSAMRGASVLDAHQQHSGLAAVIGAVEEAWREGNQIIARLRLSSRPEVAGIVADIGEGVVRSASAGFEVMEWRRGESNGRRVRTAVRWRPREVSFVPVSADPNCRTRSVEPVISALANRAATNRAIRDLCNRAGIGRNVVDDLIDRGASVEDARGAVLDQLLARGRVNIMTAAAHNMTSLDNPEAFIRAAGEALYVRIDPSFQPSAPARQYIGLTIPDLARECLRRMGTSVSGLGGPELVTRALHTTSDFSLLLADVINKTVRASYTAASSGVRSLARQTTANDFRLKHRLMLDTSGFVLEKVNEHGEFKSGTLVEGEETYRIDTFGRIFGISRQSLVNDDTGVFADLSRRLGGQAAAFEAGFLVDLLVSNAGLGPTMKDTKTLFHADHGNVASIGSEPSENSLSEARLAMRRQTAPGGGPIDVTPFAVLVPPDLETSTEKLLTAIQATKTDDTNPFSALRLVVEPRLTDETRWYVVASPTSVDGLEYSYLSGAAGPQIESRAGFNVDGVEIRVRLDYGGGWVEHRSWFSNEGGLSS